MEIRMIVGNMTRQIVASALMLALVSTSTARAVVIRGGDGSGNTSAPADDPGWGNVGQRGDCGAVYIANGWVLTAGHVGPGPVVLNGARYEVLPGSWRRVSDPSRAGRTTDLGLFQIIGRPTGVRNLLISRQPPPTGATMLAIGNGRNRAPQPTTWYVDTYVRPNVWKESLFPGGRTIRKGFKYAAGQAKRWGKARVSRVWLEQDYGQGPTCTIEMTFHATGGCGDDEMQLANHDSGGALFRKSGRTWELAGILATKGCLDGQPNDTAVFGDLSYAVDVSAYADEIRTTVYGPENSFDALMPYLVAVGAALGGLMLIACAWNRYRRRRAERAEWSAFED